MSAVQGFNTARGSSEQCLKRGKAFDSLSCIRGGQWGIQGIPSMISRATTNGRRPLVHSAAMTDEVMARGKFLQLVRRNSWEFCERVVGTGVVLIVAVTREKKMLLVEQFRPALNANVLEVPAGLVGDIAGSSGEAFTEAAKRELVEETGYEPGRVVFLAEGPVSSGLTNEVVSFFLASDLKKVGDGGGDESEDIAVHEIEVDEVENFAAERAQHGCLVDPKLYAALYFAKKHLGSVK